MDCVEETIAPRQDAADGRNVGIRRRIERSAVAGVRTGGLVVHRSGDAHVKGPAKIAKISAVRRWESRRRTAHNRKHDLGQQRRIVWV